MYLENVALRVCHDAVKTISATLVGTNTTEIFDLLEGTFGVDFPKDEEDDDKWNLSVKRRRSVSPRHEQPLMQLLSQLALLSFLYLLRAHLLPTCDLPLKLKAKAYTKRMNGQKQRGSLK